MNQIPLEVLVLIFDRLPIGQFDECRLVCKKWQFTIDRLMSLDCLVVYRNFLPINQKHFLRNERVSLRYCVHLDALTADLELKRGIYRRFRKIFLFEHFKTFSSSNPFHNLTISHSWLPENVINAIGHLNQLEEIQLNATEIRPDWCMKRSIRLSLPNLKSFKTTHLYDTKLILDAPRLTSNWYIQKVWKPSKLEPVAKTRFFEENTFVRLWSSSPL